MKSLNGSVLRCIFAIVLGTCIGSLAGSGRYLFGDNNRDLFYHTGIFSLLNYFTREKVEGEPSPMFPIDGVGSVSCSEHG